VVGQWEVGGVPPPSRKINLKMLKACTFLEFERPGIHETIIVKINVFLFHEFCV
jgi:hypothetical protein